MSVSNLLGKTCGELGWANIGVNSINVCSSFNGHPISNLALSLSNASSTGAQLLDQPSPSEYTVRSLVGGSNINITENSSTITISTSGGGGNITINTDNSGSIMGNTFNLVSTNPVNNINCGSTVSFNATDINYIVAQNTDGNYNTCIGNGAGNPASTGINSTYNCAFGYDSFSTSVSGQHNSCFGANSGVHMNGLNDNCAFGYQALYNNNKGNRNVAIGSGCSSNAYVDTTTCMGYSAAQNSSGAGFIAIGVGAMNYAICGSNIAIGSGALETVSGSSNIALGDSALGGLGGGSNNIVIGYNSASSYGSAESGNILIGNNIFGNSGETNITRIKNIHGITTNQNNAIPVVIDSTGQLGTNINSSISVYKSSAQSSVGTADTLITWDTVNWDLGSNFSSNFFTAPENGIYQCTASIAYNPASLTNMYTKISTSGNVTTLLMSQQQPSTNNPQQNILSGAIKLNSGTGIGVYCGSSGAAFTVANTSTQTFFQVSLLARGGF